MGIESLDFAFQLGSGNEVSTVSYSQLPSVTEVELTVVARADKPHPSYTHPVYGDHYRRTSFTVAVKPYNFDQ